MTRERTVQILVGALCVIALIAIIAVSSGGEIDETTGRVLLTALTFSILTLLGLAGNSLHESGEAWSWLGAASIGFCFAAAVSLTALIWGAGEGSDDNGWKLALIFSMYALATSHGSLLLRHIDERSDAGALARYATFGCAFILATIFTGALIADYEGDESDEQIILVLGILYLLGTVVSPLLRLGESRPPGEAED